jgi:hypothetical protein
VQRSAALLPSRRLFCVPLFKNLFVPTSRRVRFGRPFFSVELRVRFRPPVLWLWNYRVIFKNSGSVLSKFSGGEWS